MSRRELTAKRERLRAELLGKLLSADSHLKEHPEFEPFWTENLNLSDRRQELVGIESKLQQAVEEMKLAERVKSDCVQRETVETNAVAKFAEELGRLAFTARSHGELPEHERYSTRQALHDSIAAMQEQKKSLVASEDARLTEKAKIQALQLSVSGKIKFEEMKISSLDRELGQKIIGSGEEEDVRCDLTQDLIDTIVRHRQTITEIQQRLQEATNNVDQLQSQFQQEFDVSGECNAKALHEKASQVSKDVLEVDTQLADLGHRALAALQSNPQMDTDEVVGSLVRQMQDLDAQLETPTGFPDQVSGWMTSGNKNRTRVLVAVGACVALVFSCCICSGIFTTWFGGNAERLESENKLKQIGLALHLHHDTHKQFPASASLTKDGRVAHSWRSHLLPFLEYNSLSDQMDYSKPWTEEPNSTIREEEVPPFRSPFDSGNKPNQTSYLGIVGEHAFFPPKPIDKTLWPSDSVGHSFSDITDNHSSTIAVIEVINSGIRWMEPKDLTIDEAIQLIKSDRDGVGVVMADGTVHRINSTTPEDQLRAMMTIDGGEEVTIDPN